MNGKTLSHTTFGRKSRSEERQITNMESEASGVEEKVYR
jgi:hypothetical protein